MKTMGRGLTVVGLSVALIVPVSAQEPTIEEVDLPRHVADEVIAFFNDPGTITFTGRSSIPAGRAVHGDVAVLGGPFTVAGEVDGDLVVVNGDLDFVAGASVTGNVTVVGGEVLGSQERFVGGTLAVYDQALRYSRRGDRISYEGTGPRARRRLPALRYGGARFSVRSGINYNRVEGLPVFLGPVIQTDSPRQFRLEAFAIWRSDYGFDIGEDELGYRVRAEQRFGQGDAFALGGTIHSEVVPMERWGLTDLEASLATFLLHSDYRDYHEREGWSAYFRLRPPETPLTLTLEYRDERFNFLPARSPWSLRDNNDEWRAQPLIAAGDFQSIGGQLQFDDRNDPDEPSDGWLITANARIGLDGPLTVPQHELLGDTLAIVPEQELVPMREFPDDLAHGFVSVTRYNRVGPSAQLNFRGIVAGSLNGDPLPPQFQHALGGEGSLPGYHLFAADCGARDRFAQITVMRGQVAELIPTFQAYGCDRMAFFQAEYRGRFGIDVGWGDDEDWDFWSGMFFDPSWAIFFDAGRGWSLSDDGEAGFLGRDTGTLTDIGAGLFLGDVGIYWAYPLNGDDRGINFFIRLDKRF